ncbi:MAG TPA: hypothetical protein VGY77_05610 [Gemmataceae bacterium]|jgi:hypothetical protein|nr:hypothetical protein [Gemmataceae bacterium]
MLVFGEDFQNDPDYQGELTDFWCLQTTKSLGPDGAEVTLGQCSNPERTCYQEF